MNEIQTNTSKNLALPGLDMSREQFDLLKRTYAQSKDSPATDDEFWMYLQYCKARGVSVASQEIYFSKFGGKVNFLTSYHYILAKCQETGQFEGMTLPLFCGTDGIWKEIWIGQELPYACKIGVYRKGYRDKVESIRYTAECIMPNPQWKKQPIQMLRKCTIADALRLAFDDVLRGIYIIEEMPLNEERRQMETNLQPPTQTQQVKLPDTKQERWEFEEIDEYYLPPELQKKGLTFERIATDETLVFNGGKKARYVLHHWSTSKKWDEGIKTIANVLLQKYPSKNGNGNGNGNGHVQEVQDIQPPENVLSEMPAQ